MVAKLPKCNSDYILGFITLMNFDSLSSSEQVDIEQRKIEKSVKEWIIANAEYPESYKSIEFDYFNQTISPYPAKLGNDDPEKPLSYFLEDFTGKYDYAYYFIKHTFLIKDKKGNLDTSIAYFQSSPEKDMKNVFTQAEMKAIFEMSNTTYDWRNKYGNEKRNLELELNGNTIDTYRFFRFDEHGLLSRIIPYSNSKINGTMYGFWKSGDTVLIANYKDGVKHGIIMEVCRNGIRGFTGTNIDGEFNGMCTWRYCSSGLKSMEGERLKGTPVGKWKYWDEFGNLTEIKDFGKPKLTLSNRKFTYL